MTATVASTVLENRVGRQRLAQVMSLDLNYVSAIEYQSLTEEAVCWRDLEADTILNVDREATLFRQMNLALYEATGIRNGLDAENPEESSIREIERLAARSNKIRNMLATVFMKLANSIARGFVSRRIGFDELASETYATLLYAVSKFNPDRGFRFSTYATHAIRRRLYRFLRSVQRDFEVNVDWQGREPEGRGWSYAYQRSVEQSIRDVDQLLLRLSARERYVVRSRFGWGRDFIPTTLQALANELGVSRERVRQVEARALQKLRAVAGVERRV